MERRNFLRNLGGLFAVSLFSPSLLKALDRSEGTDSTIKLKEDTTLKTLNGSLDMLTAEDREWTEAFFKYLKKNNVGFKWERVYSPVFETKVGRVYQCETRKCANFNTKWEAKGHYEIKWTSFSAGTSTLFMPRTIEEYRETIFAGICSDMCRRKRERIYLYQICLTPIMYSPMDFDALRGVCTRGVEI